MESINSSEIARHVNYTAIKARLDALEHLMNGVSTSQPFLFDLHTSDTDTGLQLDSVTLELVLESEILAAPNGVRILGVGLSTSSGQVVVNTLKTVLSGRVLPFVGVNVEQCWPMKSAAFWQQKGCLADIVELEVLELGDDMDIISTTITEALWSFEPFCLAALKVEGGVFEYLPAILKNDRHVAMMSCMQNAKMLKHASEELRGDRDFVIAAISAASVFTVGMLVEKRNRLGMWSAWSEGRVISIEPLMVSRSAAHRDKQGLEWDEVRLISMLQYASTNVRSDHEIVQMARGFDSNDESSTLAAVKTDAHNLYFASSDLRQNRNVVLAAISASYNWDDACPDGEMPAEPLLWASSELQADIELSQLQQGKIQAYEQRHKQTRCLRPTSTEFEPFEPSESLLCDSCGSHMEDYATAFGCLVCRYDLCEICASKLHNTVNPHARNT